MADESSISLAQGRDLGETGAALSELLIRYSNNWLEEQGIEEERGEIATVFTVLEAMISITLMRLLEPDERLDVLRTLSIGVRNSLKHHHWGTEN